LARLPKTARVRLKLTKCRGEKKKQKKRGVGVGGNLSLDGKTVQYHKINFKKIYKRTLKINGFKILRCAEIPE